MTDINYGDPDRDERDTQTWAGCDSPKGGGVP